jgi:hypothetical protein
MRDLLGDSDDLQSLGQSAWIGWLGAQVSNFRLGRKSASHNLVW